MKQYTSHYATSALNIKAPISTFSLAYAGLVFLGLFLSLGQVTSALILGCGCLINFMCLLSKVLIILFSVPLVQMTKIRA